MDSLGVVVPGVKFDDVFGHLDYIDNCDDYDDTPDEVAAFQDQVLRDIDLKHGHRAPPTSSPVAPPSIPVLVASTQPAASSPPILSPTRHTSSPAIASGVTAINKLDLGKPTSAASPGPTISTPLRAPLTAPNVETPAATAPLPPPPVTQRVPPRLLDTPNYFPTPQTPDTSATHPSAIARGRRDDPSTPVPLGTEKLEKLKTRGEFKTITAHLEAVTKRMSMPPKRGRGRGRGSSLGMAGSRKIQLGGQVLTGLRICLAPAPASLNKNRIEVILKLGGHVVLHPDTAVTHVIADSGGSAATLAHSLGLQSLSDLPEGTIIVKWDWVVKSQCDAKLVPPEKFLTFPKTTLTTGPSRMADITEQMRFGSRAIRRKRDHTPSDSETESDRPHRRLPLTKVQRRGTGPGHGGLPPAPPALPTESSGGDASAARQLPANLLSSAAGPSTSHRDIATRHELPTGPGWVESKGVNQDALDILIDGIKDGSVETNMSGSDLESDSDDGGNPNRRADFYKCGQKHEGEAKKGPNEWLAVGLEELHHIYEGQQGKNEFSVRGYQKAAGILRRTEYSITSGAQARKIKGIGENLGQRIDEFITGRRGRAFYEDTPEARTVAIFKDVYGVGKNFAKELYRKGARSIDDLKTKDYGLTAGQKLGVELYDDLVSRIPRDESRELFEKIRNVALEIDPKLWIEIMGSYRRGAETSGDIDILITRDPSDGLTHVGVLKQLIHKLRAKGVITHDLSVPHDYWDLEAKWMGVGRVSPTGKYRRIDILTIPFENWGAALLYFTGNEVFNRSLRLYARKQGYSLNQRGLYRGVIRDRTGNKTTEGEIIASRTEEDIFEVLGIRWRPPHQRRP